MFPKGIAFKIQLEFYEAEKATYAIVVRDAQEGEFSLEPSVHILFVGVAQYVDGFPLLWEAHESLEINPHRLAVCVEMIHNAIAIWITQEFLRRGVNTVQFTPAFPSYVGPESPWFKKLSTDSATH